MQAKYMLLLRAVILEVLLLHKIYAPGVSFDSRWTWLLYPGYAAFALSFYAASRRRRLPPKVDVFAFLCDIAFASIALHFTEGVTNDLHIAYFLVILASCFLENIVYSFIVGGVACLVYGFLAFPGVDWYASPYYLLRVSLLLVTAFFSGYVASIARRVEIDVEERFEQQIVWMQRLSMIGQALSAVIHEVKTPLNTIILSAENARARRRRDPSVDLDTHLEMIASEATRAAEILGRYLEFAKPSELSLKALALNPLLRRSLETMAERLRDREVALSLDLRGEGDMLGSEKHLIQVFTNLIVNALDAMPLGGRLAVSLREAGGQINVEFVDNGIGIAPEMHSRLFRPFVTSRDDYEGHGLGLYIVRWIVQKHSGRVAIRSEGTGQGAGVTVSFPALSKS